MLFQFFNREKENLWSIQSWKQPGLVQEMKWYRVSRGLNIDSWIVAESAVKSVLDRLGEEVPELKGAAIHLLVDVLYVPVHPWSPALSNDKKNEIRVTDRGNGFLSQGEKLRQSWGDLLLLHAERSQVRRPEPPAQPAALLYLNVLKIALSLSELHGHELSQPLSFDLA